MSPLAGAPLAGGQRQIFNKVAGALRSNRLDVIMLGRKNHGNRWDLWICF